MNENPSSWIIQVRQMLASPSPSRLGPKEARQAAVLVPLYVDAGQLWTVLTKRTEDLPHHRGQIAFPGGGRETGEEAWDTALRESQEEIGLDPKRVLRLGELELSADGVLADRPGSGLALGLRGDLAELAPALAELGAVEVDLAGAVDLSATVTGLDRIDLAGRATVAESPSAIMSGA